MEQAEKTLDDFKYKNFPRIAIFVDMLDTGIDVPAIRNLVFAKPVFSKSQILADDRTGHPQMDRSRQRRRKG